MNRDSSGRPRAAGDPGPPVNGSTGEKFGYDNFGQTATPDEFYVDIALQSDAAKPRNNSVGKGFVNPAYDAEAPGKTDLLDKDTVDENCGCGPFRPSLLSGCNNALCLVLWLALAAFTQSLIINGFINVVITTLEKRYHLSSAESGLIASSFDIASLIVILPVSYYGGSGNRPRWLSAGMAMIGVGSLLFASPHFMAGKYEAAENSTNLCVVSELSSDPDGEPDGAPSMARFQYVFIFANLLHGIGSAPLYTIGTSFLDDSVKSKLSSMYVGIYYAISALGPGVGYVLGGQLLSIYIDFDRVSSWTMTDVSPGWLGAWWIGFVIFGSFAILLSVPLFLFPAVLPRTLEYRAQRINETHADVVAAAEPTKEPGIAGSLKRLRRTVKSLVTNKTFFSLNFASASDAFLISGCATYAPKVIESQFGYSASYSAILVGAVTVPMGALGTLIGGYFIKKFALKCPAILRCCLVTSSLALVASLLFLIQCPNDTFAGISTPFNGSNILLPDSMEAECNAKCRCSEVNYDPICALETNTMYLTPCHAGCVPGPEGDGAQEFFSCSCVGESPDGTTPIAKKMACPTDCGYLNYVFIVMIALFMLFTSLSIIPAVTATLRCVADTQRPFAMGIQWIIIRAFGSVPGPLIFGLFIDTVCTYWQKESSGKGSGRCLVYDNAGLSTAFFAIGMTCKAVNVLSFFLAWWFYKPPADGLGNKIVATNTPEAPTTEGQNTRI